MKFTYSAKNLVKFTDVAGTAWAFTYGPTHLLLTMIDRGRSDHEHIRRRRVVC